MMNISVLEIVEILMLISAFQCVMTDRQNVFLFSAWLPCAEAKNNNRCSTRTCLQPDNSHCSLYNLAVFLSCSKLHRHIRKCHKMRAWGFRETTSLASQVRTTGGGNTHTTPSLLSCSGTAGGTAGLSCALKKTRHCLHWKKHQQF